MIHCDTGYIQLEGSTGQLIAELGVILRAFMEDNIADDTIIKEVLKDACKSDKIIMQECRDKIRSIIENNNVEAMMNVVNELKRINERSNH